MAKAKTKAQLDKEHSDLTKEEKKIKAKKAEIHKQVLKPRKQVPLNQLNLCSRLGRDKAKEFLGDDWVE